MKPQRKRTALDDALDALERTTADWRKSERMNDQLIGERDNAEEAVAQIYYLITGRSPEWSNRFGYEQAIEDIGDCVAALKAAVKMKRRK